MSSPQLIGRDGARPSMAYLNENYLKLQAGYLFPEIARRVREFCEKDPDAAKKLIRCGIGDVTEPLPQAAINAMKRAADELGDRETFRGYGPEQGYEFLRSAIAQHDFRDRKIGVADDEIFVSDGSKCDCGFILDILGDQNKVAITDPVYPVYVDTNVMAGHTGAVQRRQLRGDRLLAVYRRKQFRSRTSKRTCRSYLPLFSE